MHAPSFLFFCVCLLLLPRTVAAQGSAIPASQADLAEKIRPILVTHCYDCHSQAAKKPGGNFRLDQLSSDLAERTTREQWEKVLKRIQAGEMPPRNKTRFTDRESQLITSWIGRSLAAARKTQGRVVLRRLNRSEYENTVRDLLDVVVDVKDLLPQDTSAHGFDNIGEALHTSSFLMERYLEAADKALSLAIANLPQPPLIKKRYSLKNERHVKTTTERVFRLQDETVICFSSSEWQAITLWQFYPPDRGFYRFRISASAVQSGGKPVPLRVEAGSMLMAGKSHLVNYYDVPPEKPIVLEFVDFLEARSTIRLLPYGLASAQAVHKIGADTYAGAGVAIHAIEVEGPLHETWPPASHRRIFGDLPQAPAPVYNHRDRKEVVSKDPEADARRILRNFARRAFRRTVTEDDIKPFMELVKRKLEEKRSFEQAVRVGLLAILVSPEFLFLREKPGQLDDFALASRLSYFLWSTMPDDELLTLAEARKLSDPATLHRQVERLLNHRKSAAFTENFVGQWLNLRDIDFTSPDFRLYPEFDQMLKAAMIQETHRFFEEVLKKDLSLTNFVASDFTFLNERLAKHYGIPGVTGHAMRKVKLPADSHRGGVLTMASVLKVTANGTNTSPVVRGAWVLDRILGTPPSPPPSGVPAVEPDIRGATTIREQLAKHRQLPSCATCHTQIDPPGFALESFDVIGGWREHYRSVGKGQPVTVEGRRMPYARGPKVDPADVLPDGRRFRNIDEFKQLLLKDRDQLARALTQQLLTYATGAAPSSDDKPALDAILKESRAKDHGFRSLIHAIVQSELFRRK